jgi:hypothetical protein
VKNKNKKIKKLKKKKKKKGGRSRRIVIEALRVIGRVSLNVVVLITYNCEAQQTMVVGSCQALTTNASKIK